MSMTLIVSPGQSIGDVGGLFCIVMLGDNGCVL